MKDDEMIKAASDIENEIRNVLKESNITHLNAILTFMAGLNICLGFIDQKGHHVEFEKLLDEKFPGSKMGILLHQVLSIKIAEKYPEYSLKDNERML